MVNATNHASMRLFLLVLVSYESATVLIMANCYTLAKSINLIMGYFSICIGNR